MADEQCRPLPSANLGLLDDMFESFVETNIFRGRHFDLTDILAERKKRGLRFEHLGLNYRCGLAFKDCYADMDQLDLKFCHEEYVEETPQHEWHRCDDALLPKTRKILRPCFGEAIFWIQTGAERVQVVVLHSDPSSALPRIRIALRKGCVWDDVVFIGGAKCCSLANIFQDLNDQREQAFVRGASMDGIKACDMDELA
jgi:hypothetical protein